jgi:hypothetical protein
MGAEAAIGQIVSAGSSAALKSGMLGELTPAAAAQRRLFKKAKTALDTGEFVSAAEKAQAAMQGNDAARGDKMQGAADVARMQAFARSGALAEAQRQRAIGESARQAQVQATVQQGANQLAQQRYQNAQGLVDAQAARMRAFYGSKAAQDSFSEAATKAGDAFEEQPLDDADYNELETDGDTVADAGLSNPVGLQAGIDAAKRQKVATAIPQPDASGNYKF